MHPGTSVFSRPLPFPGLLFCTGGVILALLVFVGCVSDPPPRGVVARINGEPIYLSEVRADHDLHYMNWSSVNDFDVQSLGAEYGTVLANIILQRLIEQTLAAEQFAVSDEDVAREEALIRADYPDDKAFEQTLIEEYVDLDQWRERLRSRLSTQRFLEEYLRPRVSVTYEDAKSYYREHRSEFLIPERFVFTVFQSKDREALIAAFKKYQKGDQAAAPQEGPSTVDIHEMDLPGHNLSAAWHEHLVNLAPGSATNVIAGTNMMTILFLHERLPQSFLSPSAAYSLVEQRLVEEGMQTAFDGWLNQALSHVTIEITGLLNENAIDSQEDAGEPPVQ
ncbi:peptidylprolyl isomerase [Desulfoplanes sp. PS50]|jgi:hypothetical protein